MANVETVAGETLHDLTASFRRSVLAKGSAERTVVLYAMSVRFYGEWLTAQGRPATLDQLTRNGVESWTVDLMSRNAVNTVRTRWKGLHRFCKWLVDEDLLTANPMTGLVPPDAEAAPVPVLADAQLTALIKACSGRGLAERRDEVIVRMLLDCGIRVSELCGLKVADLDLDQGMTMVTGKAARNRGPKIRPVYFGPRTTNALDRYLRERRKHRWAHLPALLLGERGAMSPDGVRDRLHARATEAGLTDRLHPHRFRHTFAHDYLLNGGEGRDLMRLAGWTSEAMLGRYGSSVADLRARTAAKRLSRGDRV